MSMYHIATVIIALAGFGLALAAFGFLAPWFKSKTGIVLFSTILNIWLILWAILFRIIFGPEYEWERYVRNFIFTFTAANSIALPVVVLRIQIVGYRARKLASSVIKGSPLPPDVLPPRPKDSQ